MSFGLAFAQGLIGGFTKNIEREQDARGADDKRLADLQDMLFQGTITAAANGKPVPKELGAALKSAKSQLKNRDGINIFGTNPSERLSIDMDDLSGVVNGVDANFYQIGNLKIPMPALYAEEKDQLKRSSHWMNGINMFIADDANFKRLKKELEVSSISSIFSSHVNENKGLYKALMGAAGTPKGSTTLIGVPRIVGEGGMFKNFSKLDEINVQQTNEIEQDISVAKEQLFGKKNRFKDNKSDNNSIILPYLSETSGKNEYFAFQLDLKDLESLKRIAAINNEKDPSVFIAKYRKSIGMFAPEIADSKLSSDNKQEIKKFFPSVFHAIQLEKLGASKDYSFITPDEKKNIVSYLETKVGSNVGDRVRALAPVMRIKQNQKLALVSKNNSFIYQDSQDKDALFKDSVNVTMAEFKDQYIATRSTNENLNKLMAIEAQLITAPGGVVRYVQQFFGSLVATTGVGDQVSNIMSGKKKDGVTQESLRLIIEKIKKEGGIETDLMNMSKSESIMIALAADMARAVDPSGRLSNQDFEVQLRRLGASSFFGSKVSSTAQLTQVMEDFQGRARRIEMIEAVRVSAMSRNFTARDFQILNANAIINNLPSGTQAAGGGSGTVDIIYDEGLTFDSNKFVGSNGEVVTQKRSPNKENHYFVDGKRVDPNTLRKKDAALPLAPNKEIKDDKTKDKKVTEGNKEVPSSSASVKGTYLSGNNVDGMTLVDPNGNKLPGKYVQRNGKFVLKPEGEGI